MIRLPSGKRVVLWTGALLLAMGVTACGGGGEGDLTARLITDAELATMALYEVDLSEEASSFVRTVNSGIQTNEQSARRHFNPEDEIQDLEQFGQVSEYVREYKPPGGQAPATVEGAIAVVSEVQLFRDVAGAEGYFEDDLVDLEGEIGRERDGETLEDVERFNVGNIADESAGLRTRMTVRDGGSERPAYGTRVSFRRGRLLVSITVVRTNDEDINDEVEALVRSLDDRIKIVLQAAAVASPTVEG